MPEPTHNPEHIFLEKARIEKLSLIREIVFGAQDGLLVPLGVVSSVAGAFLNSHIVLVAGIAEALAGAFSMGTGAYLASQAEKQVHDFEIKKEKAAIVKWPKEEQEEMVLLFQGEGLNTQDAQEISDRLYKSEKAFTNTMIQKELGLDPYPVGTPMTDAIYVGFSYLLAAVIPVLPYFFVPVETGIVISILLTLFALFTIGLIKAKFAELPPLKSGLQILAVGTFSGIGGYIVGILLPHLLGIK